VGIATGPHLLIGLAVAAAVGASCEVLAPLHGGRRPLRAYALDLTHAIGNRCLILPPVAVALTVAAPAMAVVVPASIRNGFAGLHGLAQVAVILVLTDLTNYVAHRGLHQVGFLWSFHAVHHSSERLDWLATSRGHPLDLAFNIFAISLPSFALDRVDLAPWLVTFFFLYPFVCHANARIRIPRLIGAVLVTPEFHHWHHAAEARAHDRNFGSFLSVWDRLFGTAIEPGDFPDRYGIEGSDLDGADYVGQLAAPLRTARAS
jgi:sterol desaturase/sphingolipid hydroxylase (fatty acid hydroxylase superfamily)